MFRILKVWFYAQVLYLGAASGTSVSHVSDVVGPQGTVYAVEFSHRSGGLIPAHSACSCACWFRLAACCKGQCCRHRLQRLQRHMLRLAAVFVTGRDLVNMAKKRPNIVPIIEDARHPQKYRMLVPMVDVIFADVAQPDQVSWLRIVVCVCCVQAARIWRVSFGDVVGMLDGILGQDAAPHGGLPLCRPASSD